MENEFFYKVLKVIAILVLGALGIYIIIFAFPAMMESRLLFRFVALVFVVPIGIIIIGIVRSFK